MTMVSIASSVTIRKPIDEVFDYVTTIANWGVMHPAMARLLVNPPDHPTRVGETFVEHFAMGPIKGAMLWTVKESTRPTRWTGETVMTGLGPYTFSFELAETNGGTRVEMRTSYANQTFLAKLVIWLFLERNSRETVAQGVVHLQHALENGKSAHH